MNAIRFVVAVFTFSLASLASASNWDSTTQTDRNNRILAQARYELGMVAGQCKTFASEVVRIASNQANGLYGFHHDIYTRSLPETAPFNGESQVAYYWLSDPFSIGASGSASALSGLVPGNIIQMRIRMVNGSYTPHTAIVEVNNPGAQTMTFIESNYNGDSTVKRRQTTYGTFMNSLQQSNYFTIYTIH